MIVERAEAVLREARESGLVLEGLPNNTAKVRLILDLAEALPAAGRLRVLDVGCGGRRRPFELWEPFLPLSRYGLSDVKVVNEEGGPAARLLALALEETLESETNGVLHPELYRLLYLRARKP